jgi:hypothetical protein
MAYCILIAYLFANVRHRFRRRRTPDEGAWLAYYYENSIKPTEGFAPGAQR